MAANATTFYINGTHVLPRADVLLHKKRGVLNTIQRIETRTRLLEKFPHEANRYENNRRRILGWFGIASTNLSVKICTDIQTAAVKVDNSFRTFIHPAALDPLCKVGLAIGHGFREGIEDLFCAYKADFELMTRPDCARYINNSLVHDLVKFYNENGIEIDRRDGVQEFYNPITLEIPKDPVTPPTARIIFDRESITEHLNIRVPIVEGPINALNQRIANLELEQLDQYIEVDHTAEIAALREQIHQLEASVCPLRTGFYRPTDLADANLPTDDIVTFLNSAIINQNLPPLTDDQLEQAAKHLETSHKLKVRQMIKDKNEALIQQGVSPAEIETRLRDLQEICDQSLAQALRVSFLP